MSTWISELFEKTNSFIPHGHCYLWIPSLLWLHVISDALIGTAYVAISFVLYFLVRRIRLPFSPVFIAFGLFIGLCGLTHFMNIWTVWNPDYWAAGLLKAATAAASVATAVGLVYVRPQVEEVVHAARLSEERRIRLENTNAELESLYEKLKEQDELKMQFFANVSHELRTPLALIMGPAERMMTDGNLNDSQRRQLQSMARNSKSLLRQVNDLLDVARLEEGRLRADYVRLDVAPWFRRICSQFDVAAEQRDIRFDLQAPDDLVVEVDADMLERVLINLLSNAFKFTPEGGEIRAELKRSDKDSFCFSVSDSGPGVSAEHRQLIFERFRQSDGSATRRHGGVGLGLAIARDFAELHGGSIEVNDAPAGGAHFMVQLPVAAPASAEVAVAPEALAAPTTAVALESAVGDLTNMSDSDKPDASADHSPDRPTVLVVEDTLEMSHFLAATLRTRYNVVTASDGYEALERAVALHPDLVVTDIMMPRMSGDQLVAALRERKEFNTVPILLLTAKEDDELRVRLLSSGAQDYLTKPFVPDELLARVDNLVAVKRTGDLLRSELESTSGDVEAMARQLAIEHRELRAALEMAEVARERAEQASEVKSHFLALVSHEMRTPLSTISMNVHLLGRNSEVQSDTFKTQLDRTARATEQLSTVIEGLLEYTRMESGKTAVNIEKVDGVELSREVIEFGKLQNQSPEVALSVELPQQPVPPLHTDARLLRVMLNNLVVNALKFTSEGQISLEVSAANGRHSFAVRDTGIGIPRADLRRIFLPFEQLEPVQRKSIPGVGLGLALTKELVETLGGHLGVESEEGAGSTFRILLPSDSARAARSRKDLQENI